ncbi:methyltransferase domain-containing protein [Candidatus Woesearchaeota archaeon]|nr:methyltransferase domain-containing protein [Candidatus Woesearchaeota archaeon]
MIVQVRKLLYGPDADFWSTQYAVVDRQKTLNKLSGDHVARFLRTYTRGKFLEAGCGVCQYSYDLHTRGITSYGIDYSTKAVRSARKFFPEISKRIVKGDLFNLPYKNDFFDTYYSPGVIEHYTNFNDRQKILAEAYRVLKPNGLFLITVPYANIAQKLFWPLRYILNKYQLKRGAVFYQYRYTKSQLKKELQHAGFEVIHCVGLNPDYYARILQRTLSKTWINKTTFMSALSGHLLGMVAIKKTRREQIYNK